MGTHERQERQRMIVHSLVSVQTVYTELNLIPQFAEKYNEMKNTAYQGVNESDRRFLEKVCECVVVLWRCVVCCVEYREWCSVVWYSVVFFE